MPSAPKYKLHAKWSTSPEALAYEDALCDFLADEIQQAIDNEIIRELELEMKAQAIVEQQKQEEALREQFPALQKAWEEYQVTLRLIQSDAKIVEEGK